MKAYIKTFGCPSIQGFNVQKNRGFNLEHPYSQNEISMKNFYLLLQIAYIISQIMEKGSLLADRILKDFGSVTGLFKQLLEDLRTNFIGDDFLKKPIQIRLYLFLSDPKCFQVNPL